ncbi:facilitated trehalose transporter Tret1-like [Schistocerca serialis cubense]|uniref:facilitated trehalose transporter Tret1-like n=1 Tax=Schistocerca serialis cubense TaxID=2023355 RepID=UPI00214E8152|nr:facilitated trehalose transporter Tret1-like [Schistocerca serialis cubense]
MGVCLIVVGAFFFMLEQNENMVRDVRWLPILVISIYLVVFSMGCGPLTALGPWTFGSALGWSSPASEHLSGELGLAVEEVSWVAGVTPLAAVPAMLVTALTVGRWGRRPVMLALGPPCAVGWALVAFGRALPMLLAGRVLTGFCGGAFCGAVPIYTGEIAEKQIRGALGVFFQLLLTCGILYVYVVGKAVSLQTLGLACGAVPVAFTVLFFFAPETPLYLLALRWLRGPAADISGDLAEMDEVITSAKQRKGGVLSLVRSRAAVKGLATGVGLMICEQLSGVNVLIFFSVSIFASAGIALDANTCSVILGCVQVLSTLASALVVDRAGRRPLLLVSHVGMAASMAGVGAFFHVRDMGSAAGLGWLPVTSTCAFLFFFSIGSGPLPWAILGEVFPDEVKPAATAIVGATNLILVFVVAKSYANLVEAFGVAVTFWIYGVICFAGAVWIFFFVIETKGKTLEQIQRELSGHHDQDAQSDSTADEFRLK